MFIMALGTIKADSGVGQQLHPVLQARQQNHTPAFFTSSGSATNSATLPTPAPAPPLAPLAPPSSTPPPSSSLQKPGSSGGLIVGPGDRPGGSPGNSTIIGPSSVIDPRRPVSRLSMIQPKQNTVNPALFPVGSNIVFEWAFDNTTLLVPPVNLTVEISLMSDPKMTWPVANVSGTTTSVVWNTAAATHPGLIMGFYTLKRGFDANE
ncbi:hypothetical protein BGZ94_003661 [Podila epigama]|nr:hypothetical protein BGZ94_003661 [Podila epigama]